MVWESLGSFGKLQAGCHVPFTEVWLPSDHSTIKACLVECCRDGSPSGRFSHLHRGTLELCQSDYRVLGHLPDQGPSPPIAQHGWTASFRWFQTWWFQTSSIQEWCRPLCSWGPSMLQKCFGTLPQISTSTQSCLRALWTSWLCFCSDMHCQLWDLI
jgi:hypothetical protein